MGPLPPSKDSLRKRVGKRIPEQNPSPRLARHVELPSPWPAAIDPVAGPASPSAKPVATRQAEQKQGTNCGEARATTANKSRSALGKLRQMLNAKIQAVWPEMLRAAPTPPALLSKAWVEQPQQFNWPNRIFQAVLPSWPFRVSGAWVRQYPSSPVCVLILTFF